MSEQKGFSNCPSVTEFQVGMKFQWEDGDWVVVAVLSSGTAIAVHSERNESRGFWDAHIGNCTLDPDSVWEGREYQHKNDRSAKATILIVGEYHVGYQIGECTHLCCVGKNLFLDLWEPLPAPASPADESTPLFSHTCGECGEFEDRCIHNGISAASPADKECFKDCGAAEPTAEEKGWRPEENVKCWMDSNLAGCEFIPLYVGAVYTYGHAAHLPKEGIGEIVANCRLHPLLPPEPPVKQGQEIRVGRECGPPDYGMVSAVFPEKKTFALQRGDLTEQKYFWDRVTITQLVPAPA